MNRKDVNEFEKLSGQLRSVYEEISLLSRKNPNDATNSFKLKLINSLLASSNRFLGTEYRVLEGFDEFDEDSIPVNGDVVFVLSLYLECFEKLRADSVYMEYGKWYWRIDDELDEVSGKSVQIETTIPRKLMNQK